MNRFVSRALLGLALCLAAVPALAQPNPLRNANGVPYTAPLGCDGVTPASVSNPLCVTGGGGGGGGPSATAAANGTVVTTAGTNKPQAIDLFGSTSSLIKDATGAVVDWTAPVPVTQSGTWALGAGTANIGDVDVLTLPALPTGANTIGSIGNTSFAATQATAASLNAQVVGNIAAAVPDSGNPVKVGGVNNTSLPIYSTGQRGDLQIGIRGSLSTQACSDVDSGACARTQASGSDGGSNSRVGLIIYNRASAFNGTSWDSSRGDTTGLATSPYGITASKWNYAAAANGILNTTAAVAIKAAVVGLRNCMASIDLMAEPLGTATELVIRDGAAGAFLYRTKITTAGIPSGRAVNIPAAVCGSVNTALEVSTLTASGTGAVYVNVNGNTAP